MQPIEIAWSHGRAGLHFEADGPAFLVFDNDIDLVLVLVAIVRKRESLAGPTREFEHLGQDESFEQSAEGASVGRKVLR